MWIEIKDIWEMEESAGITDPIKHPYIHILPVDGLVCSQINT